MNRRDFTRTLGLSVAAIGIGGVPAIARNRVLFRDGTAIAALEGGEVRRLADSDLHEESLRTLLARRYSLHGPRPHWRTPTKRELELLHKKRRSAAGERSPEEPERQVH